ncbi:MAG: hypothetical protein ACOYL6_05235 [Bacteriovoracaceae bacterium]
MKLTHNQHGQALIEYLFVIVMVSYLGTRFSGKIGTFMSEQMGKMAHVISMNLSVGVCSKDVATKGQYCYFKSYKNGFHN